MAQIFRKQPSATATQERPKTPPKAPAGGSGAASNSRTARLRNNIDNVIAELRKVTWPTREETRNLTIVVLGITAAMGVLLGGIDLILSALYTVLATH